MSTFQFDLVSPEKLLFSEAVDLGTIEQAVEKGKRLAAEAA